MVALVIHGGAWDIPDDAVESHRSGVTRALTEGYDVLKQGGSAVDAVEAALVVMEDDEAFDAGRGSFMNAAGEIELDAIIMDGKTLRVGAVAAVQSIRNPIRLARKIMDESEHVLLVGMGAMRFAKEHGVRTCRPDELIVPRELARWRALQRDRSFSAKEAFRKQMQSDTVGAVALDEYGNVASGNSTGGTPNKHPGRVGDSPLVGCGTYADDSVGGVATTGWGEAIMKTVLAKTVTDLMDRNGGHPERAVADGLKILEHKVDGYGGIIALSNAGSVAVAYNTPRMARGYLTSAMRKPVIAV